MRLVLQVLILLVEKKYKMEEKPKAGLERETELKFSLNSIRSSDITILNRQSWTLDKLML